MDGELESALFNTIRLPLGYRHFHTVGTVCEIVRYIYCDPDRLDGSELGIGRVLIDLHGTLGSQNSALIPPVGTDSMNTSV